MNRGLATATLILACCAAAAQDGGGPAPVPAPAPEPGPSPAPEPKMDPVDLARRTAKAKHLLQVSGWEEQVKAEMTASIEEKERTGVLPAGATRKFQEVADWGALTASAINAYARGLDEKVMDAAIAFYETPDGKEFSKMQPALAKAGAVATGEWFAATTKKVAEANLAEKAKEKAKGLLDRFKKADPAANEAAAIATLRSIVNAQATIQATGKIDADGDGIGEHGTLQELAGATGVRKKGGVPGTSDFSTPGGKIDPAPLPADLGKVDAEGFVEKSGYLFLVYLPSPGDPAGFVHEIGPAKTPGIAGEASGVAVDASESAWCAYAWPAEAGKTGHRAFYVDGSGYLLQSPNAVARWSGAKRIPPGNSALTGNGIQSKIALGTVGRDGDVWKVAE